MEVKVAMFLSMVAKHEGSTILTTARMLEYRAVLPLLVTEDRSCWKLVTAFFRLVAQFHLQQQMLDLRG
jgi:hypothetical protein